MVLFAQGGFHELHNEPDGVLDKLVGTVTGWVEGHLAKAAKL